MFEMEQFLSPTTAYCPAGSEGQGMSQVAASPLSLERNTFKCHLSFSVLLFSIIAMSVIIYLECATTEFLSTFIFRCSDVQNPLKISQHFTYDDIT